MFDKKSKNSLTCIYLVCLLLIFVAFFLPVCTISSKDAFLGQLAIGRIEINSFFNLTKIISDYDCKSLDSYYTDFSQWFYTALVLTGIASIVLIYKNNIISPILNLISSYMGGKYYLKFIKYLGEELGSGQNTNFTPGIGLILMSLCILALLIISFILLICSIALIFKGIKAKKAKADIITFPDNGANTLQDTMQATDSEWKCSKCDTLNPSDSKFCKNCGNSEWKCSECGTANPNDSKFCKNCGNSKY
jgi:hypothetical protein